MCKFHVDVLIRSDFGPNGISNFDAILGLPPNHIRAREIKLFVVNLKLTALSHLKFHFVFRAKKNHRSFFPFFQKRSISNV